MMTIEQRLEQLELQNQRIERHGTAKARAVLISRERPSGSPAISTKPRMYFPSWTKMVSPTLPPPA